VTVARRLRELAVDVTPLRRSPRFRMLWCGQLVSMTGRQITTVALPFQVYGETRSPLAVGALGLFQVVPLVSVSLFGGAVADSVDRRRLLLGGNVLLAGCSGLLAAGALLGSPPLAFLYGVAALAAGLSAVEQPARSATVPNLVPRDQLAAALALMFGIFQVTLIAGPALGGLIIGRFGLGTAYLVDVASFAAAVAAAARIGPQPPATANREPPLRAIAAGMRFARRQEAIIGGFAIDLAAMIFGMPRALFPVLAATTFHTGPGGLGLLYAAPAMGGVAAVASTGWVGRTRRQGRVVVVAVVLWGLAVAGFGLVGVLWAGLLLLAVAGAADSVSAVCRSTMLQTLTPDRLRGRMSATGSMVVIGGPYLGDVEAGAVAAATTPAVSVVSGGVLCLAGVGVVVAAFPGLWRYAAAAPPPGRAVGATAEITAPASRRSAMP